MRIEPAYTVHLVLPRAALLAVFEECDRFEQDENGGRILGTYLEKNGELLIRVNGVIGPGPEARRTATSFFQDGEYQETVFRDVERDHPDIEHLGNWHTHHVNGLKTLSEGDLGTYERTVNHPKHNTNFFYALLVVAKHPSARPLERYTVKHYLLRRGDERVYEVPSSRVDVVDTGLLWPSPSARIAEETAPTKPVAVAQPERVHDRDVLAEFFDGLRPYTSQRLGVHWRGPLQLVDGSRLEVVILENTSSSTTTYSVRLREAPPVLKAVADDLEVREFPSARVAAITTERICARALYKLGRARDLGDSTVKG